MELDRNEHYVCDLVVSDAAEDIAANELGLTLRSRLTRSKGRYAMLEGSIFDPERLLKAACGITGYKKDVFTGGEYKKGYTLLTITADGCVNKYMIFSALLLESLTKSLDQRIKNQ
jgi:hypothetical protein